MFPQDDVCRHHGHRFKYVNYVYQCKYILYIINVHVYICIYSMCFRGMLVTYTLFTYVNVDTRYICKYMCM